jgi:hypothetical protein
MEVLQITLRKQDAKHQRKAIKEKANFVGWDATVTSHSRDVQNGIFADLAATCLESCRSFSAHPLLFGCR